MDSHDAAAAPRQGWHLFGTTRFLPLFITQFLGALNDNLLKNALIMLVTYRLATERGLPAQTLVTVATGLFILPFFLFSATAGQLADKLDRGRIARAVKLAEIGIMLIAAVGFFTESLTLLFLALFLMGLHSTFFGPIKYSLLPQHLEEEELLAGNAYVEAGTFLAILLGTIIGGLLVLGGHGIGLISAALIAVAVAGLAASWKIPPAPGPNPALKLSANIIRETAAIFRYSRENIRVFRSILGISWFWLLGAAFLSQFPLFAKEVLNGDQTVVTLLLTLFSLGIGIGSVLSNRLLGGQLQSTYVPIAALGMSLFMADLAAAANSLPPAMPLLLNALDFLRQPAAWRILADLGLLALCGGIYTVPLYALMQHESAPEHRARVIAAGNVMNALFMVGATLLILLATWLGASIPTMFFGLALLNLGVAIFICTLLPDALARSIGRGLLRACYRVKVEGLEHYREAGERVLLIANHTSFLDAALIAAFLPEKITFAVNTHVARLWWMRPLLLLVDALPLDPTNPMATKGLIEALKQNRKVMIFPEGRITVTGALMKIYEGPGMIADKAGAKILPIRIEGAQLTPFSRLKGKVRLRWFPRIELTFLPPRNFTLPEEAKGRHRRQLAGAELYTLMRQMMFESSHYRRTLFGALLEARRMHGPGHLIAEDIERRPLNYRGFSARSLMLGRLLGRAAGDKREIGILLPTSVAMALSLFGLVSHGRVPALLNFSAGAGSIVSACKTARLRHVLTSRRFVAQGKLEAVIAVLEAESIRILYLEEVAGWRNLGDRLFGLLAVMSPQAIYRRTGKQARPDDAAMILFTSGSEGTPKGVVLSHANLLANGAQMAASIDFGPQDILFNCLPMFHAFGLTGGTLLPLLAGIKCFFYPSPLHYRIVPELVYDTNATILFGTDTFLAGYAKTAHPYDLHSVRYIFAGAEKLKAETRATYMEKFGSRIYEGYGATETAPVISCNTPMLYRTGTVGQLLPGIEARLVPVPGIAEGGQLQVRGPNVMLGYLRAERPGELEPLTGGWYDTGDIVSIDEEAYLRILGRTKRFAKIAGEMVSLSSVEAAAETLWPESQHAAVSLPDAKKGERIVLLTTEIAACREAMQAHFREHHLPELALPKSLLKVEQIPLLGTGKTDYVEARRLAENAGPSESEEEVVEE